MKQEQALLKMTLLQVRDWDGFQIAMRSLATLSVRRESR